MRSIAVAALAVIVGALPAAAHDPLENQGLEVGETLAASYANLLYTPAKIVVAAVGAVAGGIAGMLTGGDERAAYAVWVPLVGGDYFVKPSHVDGTRPLAFFGYDYADRPSQASRENDRTYAYEALYYN
jgi:hypothetical protein